MHTHLMSLMTENRKLDTKASNDEFLAQLMLMSLPYDSTWELLVERNVQPHTQVHYDPQAETPTLDAYNYGTDGQVHSQERIGELCPYGNSSLYLRSVITVLKNNDILLQANPL